jgi:hypothetical protein
LVVRSLSQALCSRLAKAQAALTALNKRGRGRKRFTEVEELRQDAEAVIAKYRVAYFGIVGLPIDHLYKALHGFFKTTLKMSEP